MNILKVSECQICHIFTLVLLLSQISQSHPPAEFDFIIVGGGTTGCVVASRLSENGKYSVLLLEAGFIPDTRSEVPAQSVALLNDLNSVTKYELVPQRNTGNRMLQYIEGRALGGGSTISGMFYNRGSPLDYDNWANITGDQRWNYANMLNYLKKSENYKGDFPSDQHGYDGPISVSRPKYAPGLEEWLEAGQSLGFPIADPNGPQRISFTPNEFTKRFGRRESSYTGYIRPFLHRRNLRIITNAQVSRIIFDGNHATGVKYVVNGTGTRFHIARARKEIIVSAGVFGSPTLLMKSGIGPREVLQAARVPQIKHLPVGRNLQDHPTVRLDFVINNDTNVFDAERDLTPENLQLFYKFGEGPYTSFNGGHGQAFLASSIAKREGKDWADTMLFTLHSNGIPGVFSVIGNNANMAPWETSVSCGVLATRPQSTGFVTLNLTNVDGPPIIDLKFLSNPEDMQVLLEGLRMTLKIYEETPSFGKLGARHPPNPLPACRHLKFRSDEYWKCYIRQMSQSAFRAVGTCRMGSGSRDPNAVVDTELRVIGIDSLRIVDASIIPVIPNTNPQAALFGIGERASEMILKTWDKAF